MLLPQLPIQTYKKLRKRLVQMPQTLPKTLSNWSSSRANTSEHSTNTKAQNSAQGAADYEVLVIGAGVSGIDMACHLQQRYQSTAAAERLDLAHKRFLIVEKRANLGGTWDLFKYPGIRSDSDMFTFGFAHRPWLNKKTLTDGASIKAYIEQTAQDEKVAQAIRYHTEVTHLEWSSQDKYWTATLVNSQSGLTQKVTASFVIGATGYYDFDQGYQPDFEGQQDFQGQIVHPQQWPENLDYAGKNVVVIGSGATAVTLVPALVQDVLDKKALADSGQQAATETLRHQSSDQPHQYHEDSGTEKTAQYAAHVTMLQRSPTYIASVPSEDDGVRLLTQYSPLTTQQAYTLVRWKNILTQQGLYRFSRVAPKAMKTLLTHKAKQDLKGSGVSLTHFTPAYNPWDERLCAVPEGDLFTVLHSGRADIVTDEIERFTATGIKLRSGRHLDADIIVTATGLKLQMLGGAKVSVDGRELAVGDLMTYKAVLVEGVPNLAVLFGYTNASWTLKIDLACAYVLRLLQFMDTHGYQTVRPTALSSTGEQVERLPDTVMGSLSAGYIQRAKDVLPKQGDRYPWQVTNNYLTDRIMLKYSSIDDDWLAFD